ncbi:MAG: hypothetical protein Kow00104_15320 [Rhodothalassiaceae bacterium]
MRFGALFLAVLLAAVLWGAFWHREAGHAEDGIREGGARLAALGFLFEEDDIEILGFPYRLQAVITSPRLSDGNSRPGMTLRADRIDLVTHPWTPGHYVVKGEQLRLGFSKLVLRAPEIRASHVETGAGRQIDIDFGPVSIDFPATDGVALRAARMQIHLRLPDREAMDGSDGDGLYGPERAEISIKLTRLGLGPFTSSAPAPEIASLAMRAELHGSLPLPLDADSLAAWRDAGGTLDLGMIEADWDRWHIAASGSLALDDELRPLGAMTLRTDAGPALLDWFADRGLIRREALGPARILLARLSEDAQEATIELPLMLQDGEIMLAALSLAELVPLLKPRGASREGSRAPR